jgi:acyl-CoA thioester hydrolase
MYHETEGFLAASNELLSLHIDLNRRKVAPMPERILARLEAIERDQAGLPVPEEAGRRIALARR